MPFLWGIKGLHCRLRLEWHYLGRPPWDTGVSPPELMAFIAAHPPGRALDIGCGSGTNLITLAQAGWEVFGVDLSCLAILRAFCKLRSRGIKATLYLGSVLNRSFPDSWFDLILDIGCYHQLDSAERRYYRQKVQTWLADSGFFLWYAHMRSGSKTNQEHGIDEEDITAWGEILTLMWRKDTREGGRGPAVWLLYQKTLGST